MSLHRQIKLNVLNNPVAISIPSNAMLMRKDLIDLFHNNAFSIDVDVRPYFTPSSTSPF